MIINEKHVKLVLTELYNKICTCIRNDETKEDLLNPAFHQQACLYRLAVEKETNIKWKEEQTQNS